ncbi:hypothetical protein BH24PSE2_BH24PSE2_19360 [soil metagenome]
MKRCTFPIRCVLTAALLVAAPHSPAAELAGNAEVRRVEIDIRAGETTGSDVVRVTQDDRVELVWSSDEPLELHLHGYDIELRVPAGKPAVMSVHAHATGRFPVTRHGEGGAHHTVLYLEVHPD